MGFVTHRLNSVKFDIEMKVEVRWRKISIFLRLLIQKLFQLTQTG